MKTLLERTAALALIAFGAVACQSSSPTNPIADSGPTGTDVVVGTDAVVTDTGNPTGTDVPNTNIDTGPTTHDAGAASAVTMAVLANPTASGHPASGTVVSLSDTNLVALSPRLASGPSATSGNCSYTAWVGTSTGGSYSAMEIFESIHDTTLSDGGEGDCYDLIGVIPQHMAVGDTITGLQGTFDPYCPTGTACPTFASYQMEVSASHGGAMTDTGAAGTIPTPATVTIADITGTGTTVGAMDQTLQNTLVTLSASVLAVQPSEANHNVMMVAASATALTPTMAIQVAYYSGVGCQRTALGTAAVGSAVGEITGVLSYDYGQWVIQPRSATDLPGVVCSTTDGGTGTDAAGTGG